MGNYSCYVDLGEGWLIDKGSKLKREGVYINVSKNLNISILSKVFEYTRVPQRTNM